MEAETHPSGVEDSVGLRDYQFCMGIHISRDSRRPRSSAVPSRGDAVFDCWPRSLWLDERAGRALTESAPACVQVSKTELDWLVGMSHARLWLLIPGGSQLSGPSVDTTLRPCVAPV
jgi:hypothetical protein